MLRSPITWFGGKGNIVRWLLKYVPEHDYYLEVFGGGASLLFAKPKAKHEVYNDIDKGLFTMFSVIRDPKKFKRFLKLAWLTPYSRNEYNYLREKLKNDDFKDDVEKAYAFWYVARASFSGEFCQSISMSLTKSGRGFPGTVSRYLSALEMLPLIHRRLMAVQIECLDFRECIERYVGAWDYDNSYCYLDPPYVKSARKKGGYNHEMTDNDHHDLVDLLIKYENKCKFMLSGYPNGIYKRLEDRGWRKISRTFACFAIGRTRSTCVLGDNAQKSNSEHLREETLWINYDPAPTQIKLFSS